MSLSRWRFAGMRSSPFVLILLSIALVAAAPVPRDYQLEARSFFGKLVNLAYQDKFGEVFDHLSDKMSPLAPGMFLPNQTAAIRTFFIDVAEKLDRGDRELQFEFTTMGQLKAVMEIYTRLSDYLVERCMLLNQEALVYMTTAFKSDIKVDALMHSKLRQLTPDVIAFRAKFDALSQSAKDSLIHAFPFFGRLEEIEAHVRVFDAIYMHFKGMCENVEGVKECGGTLKLF